MMLQTYFLKNTLENNGLYSLLYESEELYTMYCTNKIVRK